MTSTTVSAVRLALAAEEARSAAAAGALGADPIAIIGMGCRVPGANSPHEFFEMLLAGKDAVGPIPKERFDAERFYSADANAPGTIQTREGGFLEHIDRFDAGYFGIAPREAAMMDPQQRLLLEVAAEALDDAGVPGERLAGSRTGVFAAVYNHDYLRYQYSDPARVDAYTSSGTAYAIAAGRLAFFHDLRGPALVIDTACSSSLVAVQLASVSLRARECDLAIVGGSGVVLGPETAVSLSRYGMLSPHGRCRTFDAAADGFGRGEGCGVVVLERLSDALADGDRVRAVIRGGALNQDGRSTALTAPSGLAQLEVIRAALADARVGPADIGYIEAHGTGTPLGDPIEVEAVVGALGESGRRCGLSSAKTNIGHLEAAAGVIGLIKAALVLEHGLIPPTVHFRALNPHITLPAERFFIPTSVTPFERGAARRFAGVSSFGFSGTNAHIVLEEPPRLPQPERTPRPAPHLLVFSAQSAPSLAGLASRYAELLSGRNGDEFAAACAAAALRRTHLDRRMAVIAADGDAAAAALREHVAAGFAPGVVAGARLPASEAQPVFVFSGQGPQWWAMGRELRAGEPVFRDALVACAALLDNHADFRLLEELDADEQRSRLAETRIAQPALFALQVALCALWRSWGVAPAAVVGHSLGEIAAAHIAGALSLEAASRLAVTRGRLMQEATGRGRMAAIELPAEDVAALLQDQGGRVGIAAVNSSRSTVISGEPAEVEAIMGRARERGAQATILPVNYAFHSHQVDGLMPRLGAELGWLQPAPTRLPFFSTVVGERLAGERLDASYWPRNMREPVRFAAAISACAKAGAATFVEIGPHPVLGGPLAECVGTVGTLVTASLHRRKPERVTMLEALGRLYVRGAAVDWRGAHGEDADFAPLPAYPWNHESFPVPTYATQPAERVAIAAASGTHPLLGAERPGPPPRRVFETRLRSTAPPYLGDHCFAGRPVFPAAGFLEMALAGARQLLGADLPLLIEDVTFDEPLRLQPDDATLVVTEFEARGQRVHSFGVHSRGDDGAWRRHATGTVRSGLELERGRRSPPSIPQALDADAFYSGLSSRGPEFGPAFRAVCAAQIDGDRVTARIEAAATVAGNQATYVQHPTLLDACLQSVGLLLEPAGDDGEVYVPVGVRRLESLASLPQRYLVEARLSVRTARTASAEIDAVADDGTPLLRMRGVALQRVTRTALSGSPSHADALLTEVCFELAPQAVAAPLSGPIAVVGDGGALVASLAARSAGAILVRDGGALPEDIATVVLMLPVARVDRTMTSADVTRCAQQVGQAVATAVQAILAGPRSARLVIISTGAVALAGDPCPAGAAQAAAWGMQPAIQLEHPELRCTLIDLDPWMPPAVAADGLAATLLADDGEDRVALRGGQRFVARLVKAAIPGAAPAQRLEMGTSGLLESLSARPAVRRAPGPGEVEIAVHSTGLNFRDVLKALGTYPGPAGALGDECSGIVSAVGSGAEGLRVGDAVMAFLPGSFATYVTGDATMVVPKPPALSLAEAAATPIAFLTAAYALEDVAAVRPGEQVLIHAGAGGVGAGSHPDRASPRRHRAGDRRDTGQTCVPASPGRGAGLRLAFAELCRRDPGSDRRRGHRRGPEFAGG